VKGRFSTILWDVDGTLLDFLYSQRYAITKCFHREGLEISEEQIQRYSQINDDYWKRLELGEITKEQLLTGRFIALFEEYGIRGIDVDKFCREYQMQLGNVYSYLDDSLTICKSLQGIVMQYVITNGVSSSQRNKLRLSGLSEVMEDIFISEEVGYHKPQREFFECCLERIGEKDRSKILVVGDSLTSDIKGGVQAGLSTCWYHLSGETSDTGACGVSRGNESGSAGACGVSDGSENSFAGAGDVLDERGGLVRPDYEISDLHMIYDILGVFGTWQNRRDKN